MPGPGRRAPPEQPGEEACRAKGRRAAGRVRPRNGFRGLLTGACRAGAGVQGGQGHVSDPWYAPQRHWQERGRGACFLLFPEEGVCLIV